MYLSLMVRDPVEMPCMERRGDLPAQEKDENTSAQEEELEALEAIYGEDCEVISRGSTASCPELRIRVSEIPLVSLHLHLPAGYPSRDLPVAEIKAPGLAQKARNKLAEALQPQNRGGGDPSTGGDGRGGGTEASPAGTVVIFDWAETLRDSLSRTDHHHLYPATSTASTTQDEESSYASPSAVAAAATNEASEIAAAVAAVAAFEAATAGSAAVGAAAVAEGLASQAMSADQGAANSNWGTSNSGGGSGGSGGNGGNSGWGWKTDGTAMGEGRQMARGGGAARRDPPAGEGGAEEEGLEEDSVEIFHGEAFTDRRSTFQAHLAKVYSERQVDWVRRRLLENSKIARATHNIAAWRIWDEVRGVQLHDNDDDGESAAGSRLAHMLAITRAQNVLVVVSRWFGGIHLGPDRFKHINNAARALLVKCGDTTATGGNGGTSDKKHADGEGGGKQKGRRKRG